MIKGCRAVQNQSAYSQSGNHGQNVFRGVGQSQHIGPETVTADDEKGLHDHGQLNQFDDGNLEWTGK